MKKLATGTLLTILAFAQCYNCLEAQSAIMSGIIKVTTVSPGIRQPATAPTPAPTPTPARLQLQTLPQLKTYL